MGGRETHLYSWPSTVSQLKARNACAPELTLILLKRRSGGHDTRIDEFNLTSECH